MHAFSPSAIKLSRDTSAHIFALHSFIFIPIIMFGPRAFRFQDQTDDTTTRQISGLCKCALLAMAIVHTTIHTCICMYSCICVCVWVVFREGDAAKYRWNIDIKAHRLSLTHSTPNAKCVNIISHQKRSSKFTVRTSPSGPFRGVDR